MITLNCRHLTVNALTGDVLHQHEISLKYSVFVSSIYYLKFSYTYKDVTYNFVFFFPWDWNQCSFFAVCWISSCVEVQYGNLKTYNCVKRQLKQYSLMTIINMYTRYSIYANFIWNWPKLPSILNMQEKFPINWIVVVVRLFGEVRWLTDTRGWWVWMFSSALLIPQPTISNFLFKMYFHNTNILQ